jgi:hypothetical protein
MTNKLNIFNIFVEGIGRWYYEGENVEIEMGTALLGLLGLSFALFGLLGEALSLALGLLPHAPLLVELPLQLELEEEIREEEGRGRRKAKARSNVSANGTTRGKIIRKGGKGY